MPGCSSSSAATSPSAPDSRPPFGTPTPSPGSGPVGSS
ncbi:hypothetical protein ABIC30_006084 [Methylobacterium sp. 1030]